jgi:flagellar basal-body rod protein FlgB
MALFTDRVTGAVEAGLDAVALRQRVIADNIANAETPGFRARRVTFEQSLAAALEAGTPEAATAAIVDAGTEPNGVGNTVQLEQEVAGLVKSGLQYDALVAALNYKLGLLRTAIEGR